MLLTWCCVVSAFWCHILFCFRVVLYLNCHLFYFRVFCMCCWLSVVYIRILMSRIILFSCCIISELSFVLFRGVLYVLLTWRYVVSAFWCHIWFCFRVVSVLYYIWIVFCFISGCFVAIDDRIYPIELDIKDTIDIDRSASYLDLHLEIEGEGRLRTKLYDKRYDFNFPSWTFQAYVAAFQQHLQMEYIYLSWYGILELVVPIRNSLIEGCC